MKQSKFKSIFVYTASVLLFITVFMVSSCSPKPTKSINLVNTGTEKRSITMELILSDGSIEELYTIDTTLNPGEEAWERIEQGSYYVSIWDSKDQLVERFESVPVKLEDGKSNYNPIIIDIALDKKYVIANINYLYEGGDFAEIISEASGTNQSSLKIVKVYDGTKPFEVEAEYRSSVHFVNIFTKKIPEKVEARAVVYALVPFSADITDTPSSLNAVHKALLEKL